MGEGKNNTKNIFVVTIKFSYSCLCFIYIKTIDNYLRSILFYKKRFDASYEKVIMINFALLQLYTEYNIHHGLCETIKKMLYTL